MNFFKYFWKLNKKKLSKISLLVLDVDGVLTDGSLIIDAEGQISKKFDVKDGLGIKLLQKEKITVAFLSGGQPGSTSWRAKQLGVENCICEVKDKSKAISELIKKLNLKKENVAYLGDDLNDIVVSEKVSILISTGDSANGVKGNSDLILNKKGGQGAVREIAEILLESRQKLSFYKSKGLLEKND